MVFAEPALHSGAIEKIQNGTAGRESGPPMGQLAITRNVAVSG